MHKDEKERKLTGSVAIVTGGTRGIGRAIAERLLDEGARVAICGVHQESLDEALQLLAPRGEVFGMVADVSKPEVVRRFILNVQRTFGSVHILVNNAGIGVYRSTADLQPEEWDRMISLNLSGVYYCCHEILPIFRMNAKGGDVINIGSLAGRNAFAGGSGYNASKFGLVGFSEAMMLDHRNENVRVCCIMPGSVDTEFGGGRPDGGPRTSAVSWKIAPADVADAVFNILQMPRRTTVSRLEIRPSMPAAKA